LETAAEAEALAADWVGDLAAEVESADWEEAESAADWAGEAEFLTSPARRRHIEVWRAAIVGILTGPPRSKENMTRPWLASVK
jgi:hypothetical protein